MGVSTIHRWHRSPRLASKVTLHFAIDYHVLPPISIPVSFHSPELLLSWGKKWKKALDIQVDDAVVCPFSVYFLGLSSPDVTLRMASWSNSTIRRQLSSQRDATAALSSARASPSPYMLVTRLL